MSRSEGYLLDRLLIGASGSVGVVNIIPYLLAFKRDRIAREIRVVMTSNATKFLPAATIQMFCEGVYTDLFDLEPHTVRHRELAEWAQVMVIIPASANVIGKAANGIADDLLTTTLIATECPVVFVPNMNLTMLRKKIVQMNLQKLQEIGYDVIEPVMQVGFEVHNHKVDEMPLLPQPRAIAKRLVEIIQRTQE